MRQVCGIWLPDGDRHFDKMLPRAPLVDGKGTYQLAKYKRAYGYVRTSGLAVDVGGHVGLWATAMAKDFMEVVSYEPLAAHIECYERNLAGVSNVRLRKFGLWDAMGQLHVHMPHDNTGHAHVSPTGKGELCSVSTLDEQQFSRPIDLLKIDVEGAEMRVVMGGEQTIRSHKPVIVVEQKVDNAETQGFGRYDALKQLKAWGMVEKDVMSGDHILAWS